MATKRETEAIRLYTNLMDEVKIRLSCIDTALIGKFPMPGAVIREFCFLQLRMLCELVALACLTAHGDIEAAAALRKEYSAGKIIERSEELHPDFYPWPVKQVRTGPHSFRLDPVNAGYLTKKELVELSGKCGDVLHRGSMKKLLTPRTPIQANSPEIVTWGQKLSTLLGHHRIMLADKRTVFVCMLVNNDDSGRVQVAVGKMQDGG